tara:strand:- start:3973 stop:5955 length:1983 start_codon:yes stop_codon:yes gene_type:complete
MELLQGEGSVGIKNIYKQRVKDVLLRSEKLKNSFIGGLPITLEQKDMSTLNTKNSRGESKYTVTQKVDGTRMLMYIANGDLPGAGSNPNRRVYFIDRNNDIYMVRNSVAAELPSIKSREMLIDGEVVFFDKNNIPHKELDPRSVKGVSFMAFDILYGPNKIDIDSDGDKIIGQDSSMVIPEDGVPRLKSARPWTYIDRYDILYKIIMPGPFNNNNPILTSAFQDVNWFNIEIKPIYYLNRLEKNYPLYNSSGSGYLQKLLKSHRDGFYNMLKQKFNKQITMFIENDIKLDGLVFTSVDTLYTSGAWNKSYTQQFKWKPKEEQTVDMKINLVRDGLAELLYLSGRNNEMSVFQVNYKPVLINVPFNVQNGSIVEFSLGKTPKFIFKEVRNDKTTPNSLRTILNVIKAFDNPVDINDLYYFINLGKSSSDDDIRQVLKYSTRTSLLKCISTASKLEMLEPVDKDRIQKQINEIGQVENLEIELRLGNIIGEFQSFRPDIDENTFNSVLQNINSYDDMTKTIEDYVDVYRDDLPGIRTRYIYSRDFKKFILLESILKKRDLNIDLKMSKVWERDIRLSKSFEIRVKDYNTDGKSYLKQRISYIDPNEAFRIDFTTISDGDFIDRNFIINKSSKKTRQIEIEILKNNVDINELFIFITGLISFN